MTRDADVVVDLSEPRALRLIALLGDDFYASREAALEAVRFHRLFTVIDLQTGFKVDLIVKKDRPFSDEEFRRRIPGVLGGRQLPFATPEDTVLSKLEWLDSGIPNASSWIPVASSGSKTTG